MVIEDGKDCGKLDNLVVRYYCTILLLLLNFELFVSCFFIISANGAKQGVKKGVTKTVFVGLVRACEVSVLVFFRRNPTGNNNNTPQ